MIKPLFFSKTKKVWRVIGAPHKEVRQVNLENALLSQVEKGEKTLRLKPDSGFAGKDLTISEVIYAPQALIWDQLISTSTNGVQNEGKWGKLAPGLCLEDRQLKQGCVQVHLTERTLAFNSKHVCCELERTPLKSVSLRLRPT